MLDRVVRGVERRSAPLEVYGNRGGGGAWFGGFPRFGGTDSGRHVDPDSAVEAVAVFGAMKLIASAIGSLPLKVYKDIDERQESAGSRQWRMLHDTPNDEMAADEFWELVTMNLLGWGNAFILKERDNHQIVQNLWPIRSSRVQVGRSVIDGKSVRYFNVTGVDGPVYEADILHIRGLSYDGQVGFSPIQLARQEIANALEMDTFRGSFWRNGMFAGGMLEHPNRLSKDAQDRLAQQIAAKAGTSRAGEILVVEEGMKLTNLTMPLEDAQFVEQAKMSDLRISQLFGLVPPHMWGQGENSRSMTYTNSEFGGQEFVKWAARPWTTRIAKSVQRDAGIFPAPGPTLFCEHDFSALLQSDTATRWATYAIGFGKWIDEEWIHDQEHIDLEGRVIVPAAVPDPEGTAEPGDSPAEDQAEPGGRMERRSMRDEFVMPAVRFEMPEMRAPDVHVHVPEQPAPSVVVRQDAPQVNMDMASLVEALAGIGAQVQECLDRDMPVPQVIVNVPEQPAPIVNVTVEADNDEPEQLQIDFQRNPNGTLKSATVR